MVGMLLLIMFQVPIGAAMAIAGVFGVAAIAGWAPALSLLATEPASAIGSLDLAVIPLFLLMGSFAGAAGLSADLFRLAYALVGHFRGGLAMATIGGCAGFGAICGSSVATAATMGRIALPEMLARNYSPKLATGAIAAGGTLGILIPPSVIMILYGFLTEQFIATLFIAAIIPGLVAVTLHMIAIFIYTRFHPEDGPPGPRLPWKERLMTVLRCWAVVALAFIVAGGIYGGVFTVSEAAAVGAIGAFAFTVIRRKLTWRVLLDVLMETASSTAMIYLLIMGAQVFTYAITMSTLPQLIVHGIQDLNAEPLIIIALLMVMYLILGSIFDTIAAMVITLPFVYPLILSMGFDPIWWGVVNVMVIEIGMITPPIGINVFVLHNMAKTIPLGMIFRGIVPFLYADLVRLTVIILFPSLSLWLPQVLGSMK
jgi:tripartite ATP-independent transporter DctM subunit